MTITEQPILSRPGTVSERWRRRHRRWVGAAILLGAILFVSYGLYRYQVRPVLSMKIPPHTPLAPDTPPVELTRFGVRFSGEDLTPAAVALSGDTLYMIFQDRSLLQLYSTDLKLLKTIRLEKPGVVITKDIVVADSFLVVGDVANHLVVIYDRGGHYLTSVGWYPDRTARITPTHLATNGRLLAVTDTVSQQVALISLIKQQPFYDFLELVDLVPRSNAGLTPHLLCAHLTAEDWLWIAWNSGGAILSPDRRQQRPLELPRLTHIQTPVDFTRSVYSDSLSVSSEGVVLNADELSRVHMLDRDAGKVFVYNAEGELKLVYPRDRELATPTSIAVDDRKRRIFVTESHSRQVTVFGY